MAKLARNKKFIKLDDVRVSYRAQDDTIHLSSGDSDFPTGFHLPLSKGTAIEGKLRDLLKEFNLIDEAQEDLHDQLPLHAEMHEEYFNDPALPSHFFPLGVGLNSDVTVKDPVTGEDVPLIGFSTTKDSNFPERDIETTVAPHVLVQGNTGSGKSVIERNIILGALMRPKHWDLMLIDLKKVELTPWSKFSSVLSVATTMEDAIKTLRSAHQLMLARYSAMEELDVNDFQSLPGRNKSLMVVIDEIALLLTKMGVKTIKGKNDDALAEEAVDLIAEIARLGHAAGVHLVLASQRVDLDLLPGEVKANFGVRIQCGKTSNHASQLLLNNDHGTEVRNNPRGRIYIQVYNRGKHAQGIFFNSDQNRKMLLNCEEQINSTD